MTIKLAIADDHPLVVEGISKMLARYPDIHIGASYATGGALLEGLKEEQPDVLLLDMHFPDTTGNALIREIKPQYPDLKILVLTSVDDPFDVQDMMQQGCLGYVQKTVAPEVLAQAIETVFYGEEFLEPSLKEALVKALLRPGKKSLGTVQLTTREQEILELVCQGLTNMEIGEKLFLSHRTIENHRTSLYQKFEVNNTAGLVKIAVQLKLVK